VGQELTNLREKYRAISGVLDERGLRVWAAAEARSLPYGGISLVAQATGLSRTTIHAGILELEKGKRKALPAGRSRRPGGGRKPLTFHNPDLLQALEELVEPSTRGDPESPLRWSAKSTRHLAEDLNRQGYGIGERKVADLLHQLGYSLQANAKTIEGRQHPDRNAQFEYVNQQTRKFLAQNLPVISVDTKKRNWWGTIATAGKNGSHRENRRKP